MKSYWQFHLLLYSNWALLLWMDPIKNKNKRDMTKQNNIQLTEYLKVLTALFIIILYKRRCYDSLTITKINDYII